MIDEALLPLLPSLVALIEEQGVTRAARRLRISQPRMSARLSELRRLVGDPLLVPGSRTRGLLPTERGEELAQAARRSLVDLGGVFENGAFDPQSSQRIFRVMANENATVMVGAPLVRAIRALAGPGVRVAFYAWDASRLAGLEHGALDLVLGRPNQFAESPALLTRTVVRDCFSTVVSNAEGIQAMDLDTFCARDHLLVSANGGNFDGVIDEELARIGRRRNVVASVQSHLLAIEMVATTDLVSTLPSALVEGRSPQLAIVPPPLASEPFIVTAAWHPRFAGDRAHHWLRSTLFGLRPAASRTPPSPVNGNLALVSE